MNAIDRIATKLREKLAAETEAALARKAKLLTKHADQLVELALKEGERREAILAPYSAEVRKMVSLATDPPGIERMKGMARSDGKAAESV